MAGMRMLGIYADQMVQLLDNLRSAKSDSFARAVKQQIASLLEANFAMRRRLYGDAVVGEKNIQMVQRLQELGMKAKFTGSGGAMICMRSGGQGW